MMRTVMFASILATSASTANAQDTSGDPEAGRVFARQVCSPCHAVTVVQASQNRAGFPDHRQHTRNDGDGTSRLFADAASQDAEPDPEPGTISRCDRLRA